MKIKFFRGTYDQAQAAANVPADGEPFWIKDRRILTVGDGVRTAAQLATDAIQANTPDATGTLQRLSVVEGKATQAASDASTAKASASASASSANASANSASQAQSLANSMVTAQDSTVASAISNGSQTQAAGDGRWMAKTTLAAVATSGSYADLSGAPSLAAVATSGKWADVAGKPFYSGTGAPSSSLGAAGDSYTDTTAANGALVWKKWPSGWKVDEGDSGRRDISSLLQAPYNATTSGVFYVTRADDFVTLYATSVKLTSTAGTSGQTVATLPVGFRPQSTVVPSTLGATNSFQLTSGGVLTTAAALSASSTFTFSITFRTADAWPTSLPGSAA